MTDSSPSASESEYVLVDDDGVPIPGEAETSCLMALEFAGLELGLSSDWMLIHHSVRSGAAAAAGADSDGATDRDGVLTLAIGPGDVEATLALYDAETNAEAAGAANTTAATGSGGGHQQAGDDDDEDDSGEWAVGDDGMGMLGSRAFSDVGEDDEWVLERIEGRRWNKAAQTHEYLCKWKWYGQLTWEARDFLVEEGFGVEVDKIDHEKAPQARTATRKSVPKKEKVDPNAIEARFPSLIEDVARLFKNANATALSYASVMGGKPAERFMAQWRRHPGATPVILFHGTRPENIRSIIRHGLIVPGTLGVKVLNGSAYGIGCYSARTPTISFSYCGGGTRMFVCLGLVIAGDKQIRAVNDIVVFFDESLIMPLWLVEWKHGTEVYAMPQRVTLFDMLKDDTAPDHFNAEIPKAGAPLSGSQARSVNPDAQAAAVPRDLWRGGFTKKMLKQQPRFIKDLFKAGQLPPRKP